MKVQPFLQSCNVLTCCLNWHLLTSYSLKDLLFPSSGVASSFILLSKICLASSYNKDLCNQETVSAGPQGACHCFLSVMKDLYSIDIALMGWSAQVSLKDQVCHCLSFNRSLLPCGPWAYIAQQHINHSSICCHLLDGNADQNLVEESAAECSFVTGHHAWRATLGGTWSNLALDLLQVSIVNNWCRA